MRSWLLYIPAGRIEIYTHMNYQLATINRSWDSTLDKNVNLVYGRTDVRSYARTDNLNALCPGGPRPRGHKNAYWTNVRISVHMTTSAHVSKFANMQINTYVCKSVYLKTAFNLLSITCTSYKRRLTLFHLYYGLYNYWLLRHWIWCGIPHMKFPYKTPLAQMWHVCYWQGW